MDKTLYNTLYDEILKMPVIDTHEHLIWEEDDRINENRDVLCEYIQHYFINDLISCGMPRKDLEWVMHSREDILKRWDKVEPYWEICRYTGYGQILDITAKGVYGIDGVNRGTIAALNDAFLAAKKPGHYQRVLKDLCHIEVSILDNAMIRPQSDSPFFKYVFQPRGFIRPSPFDGPGTQPNMLAYLDETFSIKVKTIDDWQEACERELDKTLARYGVQICKCILAYNRSIRFEKVEYAVAKNLFADVLKKTQYRDKENQGNAMDFPIPLQDYMMHHVLGLMNKRGLVFQFHVGYQAGNGNTMANCHPALLNNLFLEYPDVHFDLFHIGYPFQNVVCALTKMFPNVTVDMCWAHMISPAACIAALDDFLDAIPYNKISAFGGDYNFVDAVYGHLQQAKKDVAIALTRKVERGVFDEGKAVEIAHALLYDNPKRIFRL